MKSRAAALFAALAIALFASPAWAQSQTGEIFGKVTDQSGAVLPGVTVEATNTATGQVRRLNADGPLAELEKRPGALVQGRPGSRGALGAGRLGGPARRRRSARASAPASPPPASPRSSPRSA